MSTLQFGRDRSERGSDQRLRCRRISHSRKRTCFALSCCLCSLAPVPAVHALRVWPSCLPRCRYQRGKALFLTFRTALASFFFYYYYSFIMAPVFPWPGKAVWTDLCRRRLPEADCPGRRRLMRAGARIMSKLVKAYVNGRFGDRHGARIISDGGERRPPGPRCRWTAHALSQLPGHPFLIFSLALPRPTSRQTFLPLTSRYFLAPLIGCAADGWLCIPTGRALHVRGTTRHRRSFL